MNLNDYGYTLDYAQQCAAWTINNQGRVRKQCSLEVTQSVNDWIYLCRRHYELVEREFESRIDSINSIRVANLQERLDGANAALEAMPSVDDSWSLEAALEDHDRKRKAQTVYFIRCQQFIKIGIAKDTAARLRQIRRGGGSHFPRLLDIETAEIIATEPGGFDREKELHAKFAHLRHTGEWFTEAPELTQYIESQSEAAA
jgi:hypothetical protein